MSKTVVTKRMRISQIQQKILLTALLMSIVLGVILVLNVFFLKGIGFNVKVIEAKDKAIKDYELAIKNFGLCVDKNRDGRYNEKELADCRPAEVDVDEVPDSLRYNVIAKMANNKDLESVGRASLKECYDEDGKKLDFRESYANATSESDRSKQLYLMRMCSALRVIPDALPAQKNDEALMASLNQIFILSDWEPQSLTPSGALSIDAATGLGTIPVQLAMEAETEKTLTILNNIEKSIRTFDISSARVSWSKDKLELKAQASAYYTEKVSPREDPRTIYASNAAKQNKAKTKAKGKGN